MPKKITFTIEVEDDFDSFNDLETFVDHQGQKLKKELCEKLASDHAAVLDAPCCPKCGHPESIAKGQKERKLKAIFGEISIQQPRGQCKRCTAIFSPWERGLEMRVMSRPSLKKWQPFAPHHGRMKWLPRHCNA